MPRYNSYFVADLFMWLAVIIMVGFLVFLVNEMSVHHYSSGVRVYLAPDVSLGGVKRW
jgi:hypothetical protein